MNKTFKQSWLASKIIGIFFAPFLCSQLSSQTITHVIHISVDGLRPTAVTALGRERVPNFYRLRDEGAFTDNARCDYDFSVTLPNHTCQLTGRGVMGAAGHGWIFNTDPDPGQTLASNKGAYVAGAFDVAHDHGLRTGEYASKTKFSLFASSWDDVSGAPDVTSADNGRNKIDVFADVLDTSALVDELVQTMTNSPFNYVFLHLADPDRTGHAYGWDDTPGSLYSDVVVQMDARLGTLFAMIDGDPELRGHTAIVLTADHGGLNFDHSDPTLPDDYTIPFYVWGPGVSPGADLYALNPGTRSNPGRGRPTYEEPLQPIRNGEAANVSLKLLGLEAVPGSTIDAAQDLSLTVAPRNDFQLNELAGKGVVSFTAASNIVYDLEWTTNLLLRSWAGIATNISSLDGARTNIDIGEMSQSQGFYRLRLH